MKSYLEAEGYSVKSEVGDCDLVAERGDDYLIVELKLNFNLKLVFQVTERLTQCPHVAIAIPDYAYDNRSKRKAPIKDLMSRLGVGIFILSRRPSGVYVTPELEIKRTKKHLNKHLKREFEARSFDLNTGGMTGRRIVTAYKERQIAAGALLSTYGEMRVKDIKAHIDGDVQRMLASNYQGWFQRVKKGVYTNTPQFLDDMTDFQPLYDFYIAKFSSSLSDERACDSRTD